MSLPSELLRSEEARFDELAEGSNTNDLEVGVTCNDANPTISSQVAGNRSIEIFFGSLRTLHTFYQMLCEKGLNSDFAGDHVTRVKPDAIKKLVLVGHPVTSFSGLSLFVKLVEAWITNCSVTEARWSDFNGLIHLHKLYIYNCQLNKIEPMYFQNLKILWLAGNNLTSLSFLGQGLNCLNELNVARNDISCLLEEQLLKCVNLQRLNLSGNPLCILQDIQAVRVLPSLTSLHLADPLYGKCPVSTLCDSRSMLLSILGNLASLDGKTVTPAEIAYVQEYVKTRCLYYYMNSVRSISTYVALRKVAMSATNRQMEKIGSRLLELVAIAAKYRRTISSVEVVPIFTNAKNLMKDQLMKIENRMLKLKEWKEMTTKRLESILQISRWEQETEKWMKWLEFQTYGNTQCRISHSVHGAFLADCGSLCVAIHELLSALACPGLWPQNSMLKIETVLTIRDKGMEAGMERVFFDNFAHKDEPKFIPPPVDSAEKLTSQFPSMTATMSPTSPYCPPPTINKPVSTYTTSDFKPSAPMYPFPESIPGLPERSQPLFMFLVCPPSFASNPLSYLQRIMLDKSKHYKDVRVTNCLWLASSVYTKATESAYAVVIVFKVLEECLQPVNLDKRGCSAIMRHSWDCSVFSFKRSLSFAPAYIVNISITYENKLAMWHKGTTDDYDVMVPAETALASLSSKIQLHGHPPLAKPGRSKLQAYMKRIGDGFHADLCAIQLNMSKDGNCEILDNVRPSTNLSQGTVELWMVTKLIGKDSAQFLTSLDLSGNRLGLTVGLENVTTLKKLNLSYNNLTTLTGLQKLPQLIELKVGWNSLRFLHSNVSTLSRVSPRLMTLEILPNPFQDVRDFAHIPVLLHKVLPLLNRVDVWVAPFSPPNTMIPFAPPPTVDHSFFEAETSETWGGKAYNYNELASKCLTDLDQMSKHPPVPSEIDLNVSDNYLTSAALTGTCFCTDTEWKNFLVKLQLQENMISSLDCNPIPCESSVLSSFRLFNQLALLDCTSTPISSHPEYASFIIKNLTTLKLLDGLPISAWEINDCTEKIGGTVTADWLEEKIGNRDWASLNQLSLVNCGIQKFGLPSHSVSKLLTLDLQENALTSLGNLSSLPSLKVLCVSHNLVNSLGGNPCPICYAHTAQSQAANAQKLRASKSSTSSTFYEWSGKTANGLSTTHACNKGTGFDSFGLPIAYPGTKILPAHVKNDIRNTGATAWGFNVMEAPVPEKSEYSSPPNTPVVSNQRKTLSKPVFPKLEILIMAHNGLTSLGDLHLHAMQNLQTVVLNCNNLTTLQGLENLPSLRAIVLDHNRIRDVPFNCLAGCKSLKYLHLEHNRIANLPRLPHLTNLTALYLAYNKIQSLTDLNVLAGTPVTELSMAGNPLATRSDYRLNVAARLAQLTTLDGKDLTCERHKLGELANKWFPGSSVIKDCAYRERDLQQGFTSLTNLQMQTTENDFSLRVKPLSSHLSNNSPRSLQYPGYKSKLRPG
ncbi:unnamed protein product [Allacma fusca]|uniref:Leucine-rich repeat-containing protein n=1 Tax=Allacma fusca TaxID=39272 RepID=A0A8J2PF67_9HEXA|nr:unnamed protein product [Allacma fusca]